MRINKTLTDFVFRRPVAWQAEMEVTDKIFLFAPLDNGNVFLHLAAECIKGIMIVVIVYELQRSIEI